MTDENSVPEPEHLLRDDVARAGLAEVLAEYLNVTLYESCDEGDDEIPVATQQLLDLADDLIDKLDMLGIDLVWQDEGARLLAEAGQ